MKSAKIPEGRLCATVVKAVLIRSDWGRTPRTWKGKGSEVEAAQTEVMVVVVVLLQVLASALDSQRESQAKAPKNIIWTLFSIRRLLPLQLTRELLLTPTTRATASTITITTIQRMWCKLAIPIPLVKVHKRYCLPKIFEPSCQPSSTTHSITSTNMNWPRFCESIAKRIYRWTIDSWATAVHMGRNI